MKHIALSQRHDYIPEYNEYRDGLDCRWADFFWQEKILILPLPNHIKIAMGWLQEISIEALIITGGGNLEKYGGLTEESFLFRDETSFLILAFFHGEKFPLSHHLHTKVL